MKKLLSILGATVITASSTFGVVACGTDTASRFTTPKITDVIKNAIIAELNNNATDYGHLKFGDIFNNESTLTNLAIQLIDHVISSHYYSTNEAVWAKYADMSKNGSGASIDTNKYAMNSAIFENWIKQLAVNKLYNDYLTAYYNKDYLEYQIIGATSTDGLTYLVANQSADWHVSGIYTTDGKPTYTDTNLSFFEKNMNKTDVIEKELMTRFHDYLYHKEIPDVLKNVIGQTFLNQGMFKSGRNQSGNYHTYMDIKNSAMLKNWQTWPDNQTAPSSNVKMVWQYKVKVSDADADTSLTKGVSGINDNIGKLKFDGSNVDVNNSMNKGTVTDEHNINNLFGAKSQTFGSLKNYDESSSDPIWSISHFQGFAAYNSAGAAIGTTPGDPLYNGKILGTNVAGFILNKTDPVSGKADYAFYDSTKKYAYFCFVLPVYAIDVFNNMTLNFGKDQKSKDIKETINLNTYYGNGAAKSIDWSAFNQGTQGQEEVTFLHDHSSYLKKSEAGFGLKDSTNNADVYTKDGVFGDNDHDRLSLVKWIQSIYASDKTISDSGKTLLYSMAFNYDKDNVYSSKLYDAISQYIRDDNDNY